MMSIKIVGQGAAALLLSLAALSVTAQQRPPYGTAINLDAAKKVGAAAVAEARKNNWQVVTRSSTPGATR